MKALVVVDFQNDFVEGSLGFPEAKNLEPVIAAKITECRRNGGKVIFTFDTHGENYSETAEGRKLPVVHCIKGTHGHRLYGSIAGMVKQEDTVIYKNSFGSTELAHVLEKNGFEEVELCGLVTDICVISNAIIAKAALPESRIVVDSKGCACADKAAHENALAVMRGVQIDVI